jgi:EAL domain-containing protein (putative c-di-GMP-specific phosphodiesterase class I)
MHSEPVQCGSRLGMCPERLVVEVTETTVLESPAVSATLHSLPIGIVKIDESFAAGALTRAVDQAVVEAIVQMADRLALQTVAEGMESPEQEAFLVAAGITALQGFCYLPPAPVAEFTAWLADNRRRAADSELTASDRPGGVRGHTGRL